MAHVTIEWTENLEGSLDVQGLMRLVAAQMRDRSDGVFPVGGIRVRAIKLTDYVIADECGPLDAFINLEVKMGAGRSFEFRKAFFDALFEQIRLFLADLVESRPTALSMYVAEDEGWKYNTIHKRLGKKI